ncbi:MAG: aminotransferase class IV [Myxococcales bacterium]|nr:aminotransferase class IV [Myxococcales bacterium]MBP6844992.1 aminotransferase class IV [Kofleriaceae bacterium]
MPAVASIDGVISPLAAAAVPLTDRGLLFGDHVFEVARVWRGAVVDGERHLARLARSAIACRLPAPPPSLPAWIAAAIAAAGEADAALRVVWTAGDGAGLARGPAPRGRAIAIVEPWAPPATAPTVRLATLVIDRSGRTGALVPAVAKSGSYLASVLALEAARAAGADDALLVDPDGRVLETATASVALVDRRGVVVADGACLPGVTMARVAEVAAGLGLAVTTAPIDRASLAQADEVFVTSSRRGVVQVVQIDDRAYPDAPRARQIAAAYEAWIVGAANPDRRAAPAL